MHNQHKILRVLQLITLLKKEPAKSIRFLSGILDSTDRTVYRYLDLVKELGFELQKDQNNKFKIIGGNEY
jgi:DNA-binding IclR family transcriptional regulator|nr:HTH domain-containing protein [uncultured Flavobacterium sp.]